MVSVPFSFRQKTDQYYRDFTGILIHKEVANSYLATRHVDKKNINITEKKSVNRG